MFFHVVFYLFVCKIDLNFGKLTSGFGLLKLPKMPELKGKKMEDFQPTDIDVNDIKYL